MLKHEYIDYGYFGRCLKVSNESIEALITVDKGPRVISLKCSGMENIIRPIQAVPHRRNIPHIPHIEFNFRSIFRIFSL